VGHLGWIYARWRGFIDAETRPEQIEAIETSARTEIATAVLNTPLSWVGPTSWTLGWVIIPLLVRGGLLRRQRNDRTNCLGRRP
jgi:ABC-type sulfate transport system permease component